jgi:hypothetical protein
MGNEKITKKPTRKLNGRNPRARGVQGDNVKSVAREKRVTAKHGTGASAIVANMEGVNSKQRETGIIDGRPKADLSEQERLDCVREYFLTGNLLAIGRKRNIKYSVLAIMSREEWWQEELKALGHEAASLLKVKLTNIMNTSLDKLEDRITHGNRVWKEGELRTVPLSAADLTTIAATMMTKKRELEQDDKGLGTNEARRLLSLAEALRSHSLPPSTMQILEGELISPSVDSTDLVGILPSESTQSVTQTINEEDNEEENTE